ncbi:hypothetical protein FACS1894125_0110 [Actinomycetota bacterium]|nr:hypothetical protein FACS1894125_0110 [Actinomycetota bacterium]
MSRTRIVNVVMILIVLIIVAVVGFFVYKTISHSDVDSSQNPYLAQDDDVRDMIDDSGFNQTCFDYAKFNLLHKKDSNNRTIRYVFYDERFGQGNSPKLEAKQCNSDIGTISELFPDPTFAQLVSRMFEMPVDHQISQYLLDQVIEMTMWFSQDPQNQQDWDLIQNIQNIQGLEHFRNLREITLTGKQITDISVLAQLKELRMVELVQTGVVDASPLKVLENLTRSNFPAAVDKTTLEGIKGSVVVDGERAVR